MTRVIFLFMIMFFLVPYISEPCRKAAHKPYNSYRPPDAPHAYCRNHGKCYRHHKSSYYLYDTVKQGKEGISHAVQNTSNHIYYSLEYIEEA